MFVWAAGDRRSVTGSWGRTKETPETASRQSGIKRNRWRSDEINFVPFTNEVTYANQAETQKVYRIVSEISIKESIAGRKASAQKLGRPVSIAFKS